MRLLRIIGMGLAGLIGTPFRTALAALGIVIGVGAVVTLTSLGNGIEESVAGTITDLGPNLITVVPGGEAAGDPFGPSAVSTLTLEDTETVAEQPTIEAASSSVSALGLVDGESITLSGVDPDYDEIRNLDISAGRFVEQAGEITLSESTASELLDATPEEVVGQTIEIGAPVSGPGSAEGGLPEGVPEDLPEGVPEDLQDEINSAAGEAGEQSEQGQPASGPTSEYEVVGVAGTDEAEFGPPAAQSSFIITEDALELSGQETVGQILATATESESVGEANDAITAEITEAHGAEDFTVITQEELLSTLTEVTDQLNIFLAGIAGISLLVGGIGVMNIMLVSVAERTREIGIRKALGATDSDVLLQFLFEAILLATLGGAVGVALGVASSEILPRVLADLPPAVFGPGQIALAFGISALIGVVFGSLPAYRSARLAPVEALRRE